MLMVLLVSPWPDHACIHIIYKQTCLNHEIFCIYSFYQVTLMFSATMFLEFWKRRQFELNYEWDLVDYDEDRDLVRPEYAAAVPREKLNPVTMKMEPYQRQIPFNFLKTTVAKQILSSDGFKISPIKSETIFCFD